MERDFSIFVLNIRVQRKKMKQTSNCLNDVLHSTPFGVVPSHAFTTGFTGGYSHLSPSGNFRFFL